MKERAPLLRGEEWGGVRMVAISMNSAGDGRYWGLVKLKESRQMSMRPSPPLCDLVRTRVSTRQVAFFSEELTIASRFNRRK